MKTFYLLYIVRFLHQTTTAVFLTFWVMGLYIVRFLHQTTTTYATCQQEHLLYIVRFLHQTTTLSYDLYMAFLLYIVRFLHQTTTCLVLGLIIKCCISSVSYIKPQHMTRLSFAFVVVYRPFPTSNHNQPRCLSKNVQLYIVRFLHQTTTLAQAALSIFRCISSVSYIKPQPRYSGWKTIPSCISSVSYIKPQLRVITVTTYLSCISSVSYIKPQHFLFVPLFSFVVYRPFPTSNHNSSWPLLSPLLLYIVRFLHQTTTLTLIRSDFSSCISSVSYIKPQPIT